MGLGHLINAATTSRSQGRGMAVDSSRQISMSGTGQDENLYLILITFWMMPYLETATTSVRSFVKNYYFVSLY